MINYVMFLKTAPSRIAAAEPTEEWVLRKRERHTPYTLTEASPAQGVMHQAFLRIGCQQVL